MPPSTSGPTLSSPTVYLYFLITWVVLAAFNYGFGISELNPLQSVISCASDSNGDDQDQGNHQLQHSQTPLPLCIPMDEAQFGAVTALFTLGGLVTSLSTSPLSSKLDIGPRSLLVLSATMSVIGGGTQAIATSVLTLGAGRLIMGMGAGVGVVIVPRYLSDISPPSFRGSIGVLNQLAIVFGILTGQSLGVSSLASPESTAFSGYSNGSASHPRAVTAQDPWYLTWRAVPSISALVALSQLVGGLTMAVDPPSWIKEDGNRRNLDATEIKESLVKVERKLWKHHSDLDQRDEESVGLLQEDDGNAGQVGSDHGRASTTRCSNQLNITQLISTAFFNKHQTHSRTTGSRNESSPPGLRNPYRRGLSLIFFTQLAQQLSGVNAVLSFSTGILANVLSDGTGGDEGLGIGPKEIGVFITIVNALMTFPPIFLIPEHRLGRRSLLLLSLAIMSLSSFFLSLSILNDSSISSSIFIVLFVAGFSIGLGPIPFLILPELVPDNAINAASSLGMGLNWTASFLLVSGFLPLKNFFRSLDGKEGGSVFWVFTVINAISAVGIWKFYKYEVNAEERRERLD